eukprot:7842408-Karenia_brevis.AAC.1
MGAARSLTRLLQHAQSHAAMLMTRDLYSYKGGWAAAPLTLLLSYGLSHADEQICIHIGGTAAPLNPPAVLRSIPCP